MKTREQLTADYEKKLAELDVEQSIREAIRPLEPRMVHQYGLYGSIGSLVFGNNYSGNNDKVSLASLRDLLAALSPVSTVKGKGTFTRFMTEAFADSDANKEKGNETIVSIFPVTLKTNSVAGYSVKAEWFTEINGQIWSIDAYLENPYQLAQVCARRTEFRGGFRYESASLTISSSLNPPEGYWQQVKWGRGSDEYPNDFTAYHTQYDDDPVAWIERAMSATENTMQAAR